MPTSGLPRLIKCALEDFPFPPYATSDHHTRLQRAKLPKWIGQYIKESDTNLSTDMAIVQSKKFLRAMAQPFEQNEKSLWGLEQIKQKQAGLEPGREYEMEVEEEDEGFGEIDDEAMLAADLDMEMRPQEFGRDAGRMVEAY